MTNHSNFQKWFVGPLQSLYMDGNAGFAILLVTFPLLERLGRNKLKLSRSAKLAEPFHRFVLERFPALQKWERARDFWNVFRNGLHHHVTIVKQTDHEHELPKGIILPVLAVPVAVDEAGQFLVNPILFSKQVVAAIEADFDAYVGFTNPHAPILPFEREDESTTTTAAPQFVLKTSI